MLYLCFYREYYTHTKTPIGRIPKHIYFVADLRKSLSLEQNEDQILYTDAGDVATTPVYNYYKASYEEYPDNVELEWQLPSAYAFYSFLKSPLSSQHRLHILQIL